MVPSSKHPVTLEKLARLPCHLREKACMMELFRCILWDKGWGKMLQSTFNYLLHMVSYCSEHGILHWVAKGFVPRSL